MYDVQSATRALLEGVHIAFLKIGRRALRSVEKDIMPTQYLPTPMYKLAIGTICKSPTKSTFYAVLFMSENIVENALRFNLRAHNFSVGACHQTPPRHPHII